MKPTLVGVAGLPKLPVSDHLEELHISMGTAVPPDDEERLRVRVVLEIPSSKVDEPALRNMLPLEHSARRSLEWNCSLPQMQGER